MDGNPGPTSGAPVNPSAPPKKAIDGVQDHVADVLTEAEQSRRTHLDHERYIRSLGSLNILAAGVPILIAAQGITTHIQYGYVYSHSFVFQNAVWLAFGLLLGGIGLGLRRLRRWARSLETVLVVYWLFNTLSMIGFMATDPEGLPAEQFHAAFCLLSLSLQGYVLYLMASAKSSMIFSDKYQAVIALTPHVGKKPIKTNRLLMFFLCLVFFGGLALFLLIQRSISF